MHLIWLHEPKHKLSLGADCTHAKEKKKKKSISLQVRNVIISSQV